MVVVSVVGVVSGDVRFTLVDDFVVPQSHTIHNVFNVQLTVLQQKLFPVFSTLGTAYGWLSRTTRDGSIRLKVSAGCR